MALRRQIVYLIGLHLLHDAQQTARIRHVAVKKMKLRRRRFVEILIQMVYALRVQQGGAPFQPVYLVIFAKQKFRKQSAVLARYACYQCAFLIRCHVCPLPFLSVAFMRVLSVAFMRAARPQASRPVSYTHLTLPTNREV